MRPVLKLEVLFLKTTRWLSGSLSDRASLRGALHRHIDLARGHRHIILLSRLHRHIDLLSGCKRFVHVNERRFVDLGLALVDRLVGLGKFPAIVK